MARPRIAMSREEVAAFLARKRLAVVGTRDAGGWPDGEPATYRWESGTCVFAVAADGPTARNVARDPRVVVSVEEFPSYARIKGVAVRGRAVPAGREGDVVSFRVAEARVESFDFGKIRR
jgi:nitroimidazol reductase NimA-like FMN-containing flavoprotein (pyridoxamine 5'-phosphate oxidase superfamily)